MLACGAVNAVAQESGIHLIKHVVIIMQENHSFDNYFGTYPGADGIPGLAGQSGHGPVHPGSQRAAGATGPTTTRRCRAMAGRTSRTAPSPTSTGARWTGSSPRPRA